MAPPEITRAALHEAALRHLSRYAATEQGLVRVLDRRIDRWLRDTAPDPEQAAPARAEARAAAREIARTLVAAGAVDDAAFAQTRARRLARAGRSRRAVAAHLAQKGVDPDAAAAALPTAEDEALAALAFCRRRRLGPFSPDPEASRDDPKHLAALARAGFTRDTAETALGLDPAEAERRLLALRAT